VRHVRFVTDAGCRLLVAIVHMSSTADDSSVNTYRELQARGYNRSDRKYLVWMDSNVLCGEAFTYADDRPTQDNKNNGAAGVAPLVARIDRPCWGSYSSSWHSTEAHELMHNLGGVQATAPHHSANGHCTDEWDAMCYDDDGTKDNVVHYASGATRAIWNRCATTHEPLFDCGHDDYFSTAPPAGSYLSAHWNTAASRFLTSSAPTGSDSSPPVVSVPLSVIAVGSRLGSATVPVRTSWTATDASGIARYDLWVSTDGAAYAEATLGSATTSSVTYALTQGHRYQFAVRALDGAGHWSDYSVGPVVTPGAVQDDSAAVAYTTGWSRSADAGYSGGTETTTGTQYASAQITVTGRGVAWVAPRAVNRGQAWIYVDGAYVGLVDTYAATTALQTVVFSRTWSAVGTHTVVVKAVATAGRPWIDVDAFAVLS
jgi:hypothetical protein